MDGLVILGLVVALVILLAFGRERSLWKLFRDPRVRSRREMPWRDRGRWSKLAQSEEYVVDPVDARQAQEEARLALELMTHIQTLVRRRWWFWALLPTLAIVLRDPVLVLLTVGTGVSFVLLYLYSTRMRGRLQRTGELNGWDLEWNDPEAPGGDPG